MAYTGGGNNAQVIVPAAGSTFVCGFALNVSSLVVGLALQIYSAGACQGLLILSQAGLPAGTLSWYRGHIATKLCDSSVQLKVGAWYYVEVKVVLSATVGTVTIRVNGQTVATFAGNTAASGTAWDTVVVGGDGTTPLSPAGTIDDLVICDGAGAVNNDLLGDVRVQALFPTGVGNYSEFPTLVGAASQWQATSDNPADDDTSYIASATPGQRSTFATGDLASSAGTVPGLIIQAEARKDDAGTRTVAGMARSAGVDAAGAGSSVGNSYQIWPTVMETDPSAAAWTIGSVNAAEFGVKELA
jgi:hypothetical protein